MPGYWERFNHHTFRPAIKVSAFDDIPITVEPCFDQVLATNQIQVIDVSRVILHQKLLTTDLFLVHDAFPDIPCP